MNTQAQSIVIVGGGSTGWMSALYLSKWFNQPQHTIDITVIESPDIGILGVGEATVHSIRHFFNVLGIDEAELIRETHATLKSGILFRDWMKPTKVGVHEYFHPFESQLGGQKLDISTAWLKSGRDANERYDEGVCTSSHMAKRLRSAKAANSGNYEGIVPYAYHLDATLMARFLRKKAVESGVKHIEATVEDVSLDAGLITGVETNQGPVSGDFFLDCTGFRGLLIDKMREDNWQSFEDALPCDKAVAMQVELPKTTTPNPYTVSTALSNGWAWGIDLTTRRGTGYVYDSKRQSAEDAEAELRAHIGDDKKILKTLHLDMKVGRRKEFWVGNCLAMGLAGGFIEPLESTGLQLINVGVRMFASHLTSKLPPQPVRDAYNRQMVELYENLKQFIVLHYCLTDRDDTEFWRAAKSTSQYCPGLDDKLALWKHKICEYVDLSGGNAAMFTDVNYRFVLYGMQHYPELHVAVDAKESQRLFNELNRQAMAAVKMSVSHADYLARAHG